MSRGFKPFSLNHGEEEPSWFAEAQSALQRQAVQPMSSIHDQIYSIINNKGKSKFSSVAEMVDDLQERTGLKSFLSQKKANPESATTKNASSANPALFEEMPGMKDFIDTYVDEHPGTTVDAVIENMLKISDFSDNIESRDLPEDVKIYVHDLIKNTRDDDFNHNIDYHNLGKADVHHLMNSSDDADDPLAFCTPTFASEKFNFIK